MGNGFFGGTDVGVKWYGIVTDNLDPEKRFRVRASVPGFLQNKFGGADETPWALPAHCGVEYAPPKGAGVWIEWAAQNGVAHEFIWSGEYASIPDGLSENTNIALEPLRGDTPYGRGFRTVELESTEDLGGSPAISFVEPESFQATEYPKNKVIMSPERNVALELDDTGGGRFHVATGNTYHEATADGTVAQRCSLRFDFVLGPESRLVDGDRATVVGGDDVKQIEGASSTNIFGHAAVKAASAKLQLAGVTFDAGVDSSGLSVESLGEIALVALQQASVVANEISLVGTSRVDVAAALGIRLAVPGFGVSVSPAGVGIGTAVAGTTVATNPVLMAVGAAGPNAWAAAVNALLAALVVAVNGKQDGIAGATAVTLNGVVTQTAAALAAPPINSVALKVV